MVRIVDRTNRLFLDISGKKVLITGAGGDIGSATAKLFAEYGATVGIHYNQSEQTALELLAAVKAIGGRGAVFKADLLVDADRKRLIDDFVKTLGNPDVLINNAGGPIGNNNYLELDTDSWQKTFSLNVEAPFFLSRITFPLMKKAGGGKIINISSVAAKFGGSDTTVHYGAAKAALENITVALAKRGASDNILVNTIRAGVIDTGFHKKFPKDNFAARIDMIPLGRMGKPDDIAQTALFIASSCGDFITGQTICVTGGE